MRVLCLLFVALLLAGCTGGGTSGVSSLNGAKGDVSLVAGRGLVVTPSPENRSVVVGFGDVVQAPVVQACNGACRNLTVPPGALIADGALIALHNLSLNAAGPDGDAAVFFYDHGQEGARFLRWTDAANLFDLSGDLQVVGNLTATSWIGTRTPLVLGAGTPQQQVVTVTTAATEGPEVTVFARGSGQLANGAFRVDLPLAFQALVAEGAITAQVTLTSPGPALYVAEKAKDHLLVKAADGSNATASFDWFVQAPRKGGEGFVV